MFVYEESERIYGEIVGHVTSRARVCPPTAASFSYCHATTLDFSLHEDAALGRGIHGVALSTAWCVMYD